MRERFDALLAELSLPPGRGSFALDQLLDRVSIARGRPIKLVAVPVNDPDDPSGAWVPYPEVDVIFHKLTSRPHLTHIVLHEIAHMLCGHAVRPQALQRFLAQYSPPDHDPQRMVEAFGLLRSSWSDEEEREAEAFARYVGPLVRVGADVSSPTAAAFARILDALGGSHG